MYRSIIAVFLFAALAGSCKKECEVCEECEVDVCASADLAKGLLAYYPFNGNANDESGNGNNAVAMNGAHLGPDMVGRPQRAAEFDGLNDYFLVNDNGKFSVDSISVSLMVWVSDINRRQAFINRVNPDNATSFSWGFGQSLNETNRWDFGVGDPSKGCNTPLTYEDGLYARSVETTIAGKWYHLIGTFSKGEQKLYVDGQLKATLNRGFTTMSKCADAKLMLGGWWKNDVVSVAGRIDEVRIYNRILTQCERDELTKIFK